MQDNERLDYFVRDSADRMDYGIDHVPLGGWVQSYFQLSPRWQVNPQRLEGLLEALPHTFRYVFEFRNPTCIKPEIEKLLEKF
jgi:hypothetical protein